MITNYFKAKGHIFSFCDTVPESIDAAYTAASMIDVPCVFLPVPIAGRWDVCSIIGHRARQEIIQDLRFETDEEELIRLDDELAALHACYAEAGRMLPLVAVAA